MEEYIYIYIYIYTIKCKVDFRKTVLKTCKQSEVYGREKFKGTTGLSLQACFVVAHSSGDLIKNIIYHRLYTINLNNNNNIIELNLIYALRDLTSHVLRRRALLLWRQEDMSSLRFLNVDRSGWQMIRNFSLRHW